MGHPHKPAYADVDMIESIARDVEAGTSPPAAFVARMLHPSVWDRWQERAAEQIRAATESDAPMEFGPGTMAWAVGRIMQARARAKSTAEQRLFEAETSVVSGKDWRSLHAWAKVAFPTDFGDRQTVTVETKDPVKVAGALLADLKKPEG